MPEFGFPRHLRLRKRAEFLAVGSGDKVYLPHFIIVWMDLSGSLRFGITVSRKTGCSVIRNRVKRYVREYVRHHPGISPSDYNVIARRGAGELTYDEVVRELDRGFALAASRKCRKTP